MRKVSKNLKQGRSGGEGTGFKKVKRHGTTSIQGLSSRIVSGAGDRMWSQSMRICRSNIFENSNGQQTGTRAS